MNHQNNLVNDSTADTLRIDQLQQIGRDLASHGSVPVSPGGFPVFEEIFHVIEIWKGADLGAINRRDRGVGGKEMIPANKVEEWAVIVASLFERRGEFPWSARVDGNKQPWVHGGMPVKSNAWAGLAQCFGYFVGAKVRKIDPDNRRPRQLFEEL